MLKSTGHERKICGYRGEKTVKKPCEVIHINTRRHESPSVLTRYLLAKESGDSFDLQAALATEDPGVRRDLLEKAELLDEALALRELIQNIRAHSSGTTIGPKNVEPSSRFNSAE